MARAKKLRLYLDDQLRDSVAHKRHNFFNILTAAFQDCGYQVDLVPNTATERLKSVGRNGYSLFHLEDPFHPNALDVRLAYMYPFWRIEKAIWREDYTVARAEFAVPDTASDDEDRFFTHWRTKMHAEDWAVGTHSGFVFIALQGRLLQQRHGQTMTPIKMIESTIQHDPDRDIVIKFHPGELYSKAEKQAVAELAENPKVCVSTEHVHSLLAGCAYVVTQNSSVAFKGILHEKPAILFGRSDFHHIFQNVEKIGASKAFAAVMDRPIAYKSYLHWFLQDQSINAGRAGAKDKVLTKCRALGWDI